MNPDVVVVGGGPAGTATALHLARAGVQVTLVERARFPRRKVCGEYQNSGAVAALAGLGVVDRVRGAARPLLGIRLIPPHAPPVELRFSEPALACARATLDAILLDAAREAGVEIVRGRVTGLVARDGRAGGVEVQDDAGSAYTIAARIIAGADGNGSIVARKLGLTLPARGVRTFAVGGHYRGFGDLNGCIEMYVGAGAYFAINPLGPDRANVMVVVPQAALQRWSADLDDGVHGKAAELGRGHRSFENATRIGDRVSIGPLAHDVRRPWAPGAILVGDAAGFLDPFTGQGVYLALRGAERAAAAIVTALRDRSAEPRAFEEYARERARDVRVRRLLLAGVHALIDVPPLARRTVARMARFPHAATALLDAIAGSRPPHAALRPAVLRRLLL